MTESQRTKRIPVAVITLVVLVLASRSRGWFYALPFYGNFFRQEPQYIGWLEQPLRWTAFCLVALFLIHRIGPGKAMRELGLTGSIHAGIVFGLVASLPMLLFGLVFGTPAGGVDPLEFVFLAAVWPLAEEILFRGYAFGQLYRRAKWNRWVAMLLTGFIFGALHITNETIANREWVEMAANILIIGAGGAFFAWLLSAWRHNLWIPVAIHGFMNLWWAMYNFGDNALGTWGPNVARALTIALAIFLTIYQDRWLRALRLRNDPPTGGGETASAGETVREE